MSSVAASISTAPTQTPVTVSSARVCRVCIVQPLVPHYRVPVFEMLSRQPGISLSLWSDHLPQGSISPVRGSGSYEEVHTPFKYLGPVYWQPKQVTAAKAAAAGRYDMVIFSWNARLVHLRHALRICRRAGVPTLLWGHGYSKNDTPHRRRIRNRMLNLSSGCIVYNHASANRLASEGVDPSRIFVALNAIDQSPINEARNHWLARPEELARFQHENDLAFGKSALFISRLEPAKGIDLLLEAYALLAKHQPSGRLVIIGKGSAEQALRAKAAALGIAKRVTFVGSVYEESNLAPWFLSVSCMAYPVAIGLSILHAFGYGLPVVTSDDFASHNPEIEALRPGDNGLAYRNGDVEDFAAKMLACMNDNNARARMSEAAMQTVRSPDGFCIERMVKGFMDAITTVRKPNA